MRNRKFKNNINSKELDKISGGMVAEEALVKRKFLNRGIETKENIQPLIKIRPIKAQAEHYNRDISAAVIRKNL